MAETRDYDVILFGASGFTGQFVAEELFKLQTEGGRSLQWAAAGRNEAKIRATLQSKKIICLSQVYVPYSYKVLFSLAVF